jgi:hypothetical protein
MSCNNIIDYLSSLSGFRAYKNALLFRYIVVGSRLCINNFKPRSYVLMFDSKMIDRRMWDDSRAIFQQISQVGPVLSKLLQDNNVKSFADLNQLTPQQIADVRHYSCNNVQPEPHLLHYLTGLWRRYFNVPHNLAKK